MERIIEYRITSQESGRSILDFLKKKGYSRRVLSHMKNAEGVCIFLNGIRGFGHTLLAEGDLLRIRIPLERTPDKIPPVDLPFPVLYEDEDILIINKPSGMPVHPSQGNYENTLANAAAYYFSRKQEPYVFHCINRLDRDTTGALILAKNPLSACILSSQMADRGIRRTYLALAEGLTPPAGIIDAPIARCEGSSIAREINYSFGERAVTHYERLAYANGLSLLELHLETGRTHQIRVHMKHIGHPLPGDFLYNPSFDKISRQPLHSYQLEFVHPVTGEKLLFTAPLPMDFLEAVK